MAKYALDSSDTPRDSIAHTNPARDALNAYNRLRDSIVHINPALDAPNAYNRLRDSIVHTNPARDVLNVSKIFRESFAYTNPAIDALNASENFFKSMAHTNPAIDALNASENFFKSMAHTNPARDVLNASKIFRESFVNHNPALDTLNLSDRFRESFVNHNPTFKEAKEHRADYVETDYNHDLAHRSTEEPNQAIEDYNEVITSALELGENIFRDKSAFSAGNQETSSNTTYIEQVNITFNIKQMSQGGKIEMKSEVFSGPVGILNKGEMRAKSITGNVSVLADSNQQQIAEAFQTLTEEINASQDISSQRQSEILEQLEFLSDQAILVPSERKAGVIKATLSTLASTLSAGGGLAEIWSEWGPVIKKFFDIQG